MNVPLNIDWQQILLHLLNFVVLFAVLYFLLYEPVKKFMDKRTEYYKSIDEEAKKNLQQTEEIKKEYFDKLKSADDEVEEKKRVADALIAEKNATALLTAQKEAEKIVAEARKKADDERKKILAGAQNEIADMAASAAEKILVNASTSDAYDSFLDSVKRSGTDE